MHLTNPNGNTLDTQTEANAFPAFTTNRQDDNSNERRNSKDDQDIINQMLANRRIMTDVSPDAELERQRRMYSMLRYSSHYKKLQVKKANSLWTASEIESQASMFGKRESDLNNALDQLGEIDRLGLQGLDCDSGMPQMSCKKPQSRRVSFSQGPHE